MASISFMQARCAADLQSYLEDWTNARRDTQRLAHLTLTLPAAWILAAVLSFALAASLSEPGDSDIHIDFLEIAWKPAALCAFALLLYRVLRLDRMESLPASWLKVFTFVNLVSVFALYLVEGGAGLLNEILPESVPHVSVTRAVDPPLTVLILLVHQSVMLLTFVGPMVRTARVYDRQIAHSHIVALPPGEAQPLRNCVDEALRRTNATLAGCYGRELRHDDFEIFLVRQSGVAPSITAGESRWRLLVPRGLFVLSQREPLIVISMFAHEFVHVLQNDVGLWYYDWLRNRMHRHRVVPFMTQQAIGGMSFFLARQPFEGVVLLVVGLLVWLTVQRSASSLRRLRERSEQLADLGAALATDPTQTLNAIERFGGQHSVTGSSGPIRLRALQEAMSERGH